MAQNKAVTDPTGYGAVSIYDIGNGKIQVKVWLSGVIDACCLRVYSRYTKNYTAFVPDYRLEKYPGKGTQTFTFNVPGSAQTCYARIEYHKRNLIQGNIIPIYVKETKPITLASRAYKPRKFIAHTSKEPGTQIVQNPADPLGSVILNIKTNTGWNHWDKFKIQWYYQLKGATKYLDGGSEDLPSHSASGASVEHSWPSNAVKITANIKSVAKTYKENNNDYPYWATESITVGPYSRPKGTARTVKKAVLAAHSDKFNKVKLTLTTNTNYNRFKQFEIQWYYLTKNEKGETAKSYTKGELVTGTGLSYTYDWPDKAVTAYAVIRAIPTDDYYWSPTKFTTDKFNRPKGVARTINSLKWAINRTGGLQLQVNTNTNFDHFGSINIHYYYRFTTSTTSKDIKTDDWHDGGTASTSDPSVTIFEYSVPEKARFIYADVEITPQDVYYWNIQKKTAPLYNVEVAEKPEGKAREIKSLRVEPVTGSQRDLQLYITLNSEGDNFDHYNITWQYHYRNSDSWLEGGSEETTKSTTIISPPAESINVRIYVQPIAKKKTLTNKTEVEYWKATKVNIVYNYSSAKPTTPTCSIALKDPPSQFLAHVQNSDPDAKKILLEVTEKLGTASATIKRFTWNSTIGFEESTAASNGSYISGATPGGKYRIRAAVGTDIADFTNPNNVTVGSDAGVSSWSTYSPNPSQGEATYIQVLPAAPTFDVDPYIQKVDIGTGEKVRYVYVSWKKAIGAAEENGYEIRWASKEGFFDDNPDLVSSGTATNPPFHLEATDLIGLLYFQVRTVNATGHSAWCKVGSLTVHAVPSAPTIWAQDPTVIMDDQHKVRWQWTHNCEGEKKASKTTAQLYLIGNTSTEPIHTFEIPETETANDQYLELTMAELATYKGSALVDGDKFKLRVRTYNHTTPDGEASPWSSYITIQVYLEPTITVSAPTSVSSFPLQIQLQNNSRFNALGWNVDILAETSYEYTDADGVIKKVLKGDEVHSVQANATSSTYTSKTFTIDSSNAIFQKQQSYRIKASDRLSNGGIATDSNHIFTMAYASVDYDIRMLDFIMYQKGLTVSFKVGVYEEPDSTVLASGIKIDAYRIPMDGSEPIKIADDINNGASVTDVHPTLTMMMYRICYRVVATGEREYKDYSLPYAFDVSGTVIQWGNQMEAMEFDPLNESGYVDGGYQGGFITLPFNCDFQEDYKKDVELLEYIGRDDPVSYYGTQKGRTYSISSEFIKAGDSERLFALRRLALYEGDCYIRDSTGNGYYAQVDVSISNNHNAPLTNVSLTINRTSHKGEE